MTSNLHVAIIVDISNVQFQNRKDSLDSKHILGITLEHIQVNLIPIFLMLTRQSITFDLIWNLRSFAF